MTQNGTFAFETVKRLDNGNVSPTALLAAMYRHFGLPKGDEAALFDILRSADAGWDSRMSAGNLIKNAPTYEKAANVISLALRVPVAWLWPNARHQSQTGYIGKADRPTVAKPTKTAEERELDYQKWIVRYGSEFESPSRIANWGFAKRLQLAVDECNHDLQSIQASMCWSAAKLTKALAGHVTPDARAITLFCIYTGTNIAWLMFGGTKTSAEYSQMTAANGKLS